MPSRVRLPSVDATEIPPPSPELTLIGAHMRAAMKVMRPKDRRLYLEALLETLGEYEDTSNVIRLRGREYDAEVTRCRRGAIAWVKAMMSAFFRLDADR